MIQSCFLCLQWQVQFSFNFLPFYVLHVFDDVTKHLNDLVLLHLRLFAGKFPYQVFWRDWFSGEVSLDLVLSYSVRRLSFLLLWRRGTWGNSTTVFNRQFSLLLSCVVGLFVRWRFLLGRFLPGGWNRKCSYVWRNTISTFMKAKELE